jgi:hypothetical protein
MSKLNIFIDGSWLFRACCPDQVLSTRTIFPSNKFNIDFTKLSDTLLQFVNNVDKNCIELGSKYFATCIFKLPDDIDNWPNEDPDFVVEDIERIKRNVISRRAFSQNAIDSGFSKDAIYEPELKGYILKKLNRRQYAEKQVDTAVVALTVKSAILGRDDFHAVITGDADIIPAIKVAYPQYSENVFIVTTHPDELKAQFRQSAWSLTDFTFKIPPFYLQDHVTEILHGNNVYECANCHLVFSNPAPIPTRARPYCAKCYKTRT